MEINNIDDKFNIAVILPYSKPRIKKCDFVRHYMRLRDKYFIYVHGRYNWFKIVILNA